MKTKKTSIQSLIFFNIFLFILNSLLLSYMNSPVNIWFIFLVLFTLSLFEMLFFYRKSNKTFSSLNFEDTLISVLSSVGATVALIGTSLLIIKLFI